MRSWSRWKSFQNLVSYTFPSKWDTAVGMELGPNYSQPPLWCVTELFNKSVEGLTEEYDLQERDFSTTYFALVSTLLL